MTDSTSTQTRPGPDARLAERLLTLEESMFHVAEHFAVHLLNCPGATDFERRSASALADRWAGARS